jgi:hypothetical protein
MCVLHITIIPKIKNYMVGWFAGNTYRPYFGMYSYFNHFRSILYSQFNHHLWLWIRFGTKYRIYCIILFSGKFGFIQFIMYFIRNIFTSIIKRITKTMRLSGYSRFMRTQLTRFYWISGLFYYYIIHSHTGRKNGFHQTHHRCFTCNYGMDYFMDTLFSTATK